ncbi:protein-export chaperone SecB [Staphylococcus equorum]|uniref:protein-export chaperone SecB n=1 Tax=Staphylococcus equorum TaxID=246432 RepID=UPI003EBA4D0A
MASIREDVQFSNPTISESNFKINDNFDSDQFNGFGDIKMNLKKYYNEENNENDNNNGSALLSLEIKIGDVDFNYPFMFIVKIESLFEWENFNGSDIDKFLEINGAAILYSYSRAHISLITNTSKYPSFDLPFYNFTNTSDK